jgi:sulfotransferase family protein
VQVPLWSAAVDGRPDWRAIYDGFASAVDWPTAAFFRELVKAYPTAKFVLTVRSPESWADSFGETIYMALAGRDQAPEDKKAWLDMAAKVIAATGFPAGLDRDGLMRAFNTHNAAVKATIPADRLLVFEVKDGWAPLCAFLGKPVPHEPFPRTNNREEFWQLVKTG